MSTIPNCSFANLVKTRKLPETEKAAAVKKLQSDIATIRAATKAAPPPMEASKYLSTLAALDLTNTTAYEDFYSATQAQAMQNLPKPVPFGKHDGIQYFLLSNDDTLSQAKSAPPGGALYSGMSEFTALSIPQSKPLTLDLKYGFGLGRLFYRPVTNTTATWENLDDAGFYVICSATDKSIWVVFNFRPMTETGDYQTIKPQAGEKYGTLPGDKESLVIGVQKLFGRQWLTITPLALDGGDPFKSSLGGGSPVQAIVTAKPVTVTDVVAAVKRGTASRTIAGG